MPTVAVLNFSSYRDADIRRLVEAACVVAGAPTMTVRAFNAKKRGARTFRTFYERRSRRAIEIWFPRSPAELDLRDVAFKLLGAVRYACGVSIRALTEAQRAYPTEVPEWIRDLPLRTKKQRRAPSRVAIDRVLGARNEEEARSAIAKLGRSISELESFEA